MVSTAAESNFCFIFEHIGRWLFHPRRTFTLPVASIPRHGPSSRTATGSTPEILSELRILPATGCYVNFGWNHDCFTNGWHRSLIRQRRHSNNFVCPITCPFYNASLEILRIWNRIVFLCAFSLTIKLCFSRHSRWLFRATLSKRANSPGSDKNRVFSLAGYFFTKTSFLSISAALKLTDSATRIIQFLSLLTG